MPSLPHQSLTLVSSSGELPSPCTIVLHLWNCLLSLTLPFERETVLSPSSWVWVSSLAHGVSSVAGGIPRKRGILRCELIQLAMAKGHTSGKLWQTAGRQTQLLHQKSSEFISRWRHLNKNEAKKGGSHPGPLLSGSFNFHVTLLSWSPSTLQPVATSKQKHWPGCPLSPNFGSSQPHG